jgi:short-subunit dehydrogenase
MYLQNKTVWITGASSGIGEELAYACSKRGANVILSARDETRLKKVKLNCTKFGAEAFVFPLDLSDLNQIDKVSTEVLNQFKTIDLLINNAGISQRASALDTTPEVERKIMELNFFGTVALTKKVLAVMVKNGGGNIAVTSSIAGKFGFKLRSSYSASKFALTGYFESLRMELAMQNIHITIAFPGRVKTEISRSALKADGIQHGKMDESLESGISAKKCSEKYIRAIEKNKREVLIGGNELIMVHLKRFLPFLFYKIASRIKAT